MEMSRGKRLEGGGTKEVFGRSGVFLVLPVVFLLFPTGLARPVAIFARNVLLLFLYCFLVAGGSTCASLTFYASLLLVFLISAMNWGKGRSDGFAFLLVPIHFWSLSFVGMKV